MKKTFQQYQNYSVEDIDNYWTDGLIVLDTNVLLDFYCYGPKALEDYHKALEEAKKKDQLWLPNHVGLEFFENRLSVINKQLTQYENLLNYISRTKDKITELKNTSPSHSYLDFDEIAKNYSHAVGPLQKQIARQQSKHPDYLGNDEVLDKVQGLYTDDLVGKEYTEAELDEIEKTGEERYANKIPPGFRDQDKKESDTKPSRRRKYGDLIIWKQIIDRSKILKKPIIFVTNDEKDDWVARAKDGRKLGPLPSLRKELYEESGVGLIIYSADEFLQEAQHRFGLKINDESVEEVKKFRELEVKRISASGNYEGYLRNMLQHSSNYPGDYYVHLVSRARMKARRILSQIEDDNLPGNRLVERLTSTVNEIIAIYNTIRFKGSTQSEITIAGLEHNNALIRRAVRIIGEHDLNIRKNIEDLALLNQRIMVYVSDSPDQAHLPFEDS